MRRRRARPAYVADEHFAYTHRSVGDASLLADLRRVLEVLCDPHVTPDDVEGIRARLSRLVADQVLTADAIYSQGQDRLVFWVSFYMRGQEACDKLWGAGGLPCTHVKRQQIVGEGAGDIVFSQVAACPMARDTWESWQSSGVVSLVP